MNEHHISAYASSAAFFTFLSLIPMLLLLISAIPYTPITKAFTVYSGDDLVGGKRNAGADPRTEHGQWGKGTP